MRRVLRPVLALAALAWTACTFEQGSGGITAHIAFPDRSPEPTGRSKQALNADDVRAQVGRLQIVALDVGGSTLAETNLYANPTSGQLAFDPHGGRWSLTGVSVGKDRAVVANAYLPEMPSAESGTKFLRARNTGIEVKSGEVADGGTLMLNFIPGLRYPPLDYQPPASPFPATVVGVPEGDALEIVFSRPPDDDVAGYTIAISADPGSVGTPSVARGRQLIVGDSIVPGLVVKTVLTSPDPQTVTVDGLTNGRSYGILIYAFDSDIAGQPLNYSRPAMLFGVPQDRIPPGPIRDLSIVLRTGTTFEISFTAPGEDDQNGIPASYDLRVADERSKLEMPDLFVVQSEVPAPAPVPAGARVMFLKTAAELNVIPSLPFFIGMRALDLSANAGAIAVAGYSASSTGAPSIQKLDPELAIAGNEISLIGQSFGARTPTVTLSFTTSVARTITLAVASASDTSALVRTPPGARSGTVTLTRADGRRASVYLPVILRADNALGANYTFPFDLVATELADGRSISAFYREDETSTFEGGIDRIIETTPLAPSLASLSSPSRSTAIAGTYAAEADRFFFVASNAMLSMTAAFASSSTTTPNELRVPSSVAAGGADRIGLVVLGPPQSQGAIPAMIAFSLGGVVRAATVADARVQPFDRFNTYSSTTASFDRATIKRKKDGAIAMAYRSTIGQVSTLVVRTNITASPADFEIASAAMPLAVGASFELLAVPAESGREEFVLVYEAIAQGQRTEVRALRLSDYGQRGGVAPFKPDTINSFALEDAGLVRRGASVWIGIFVTQRTPAGASAIYSEIAIADLDLSDQEVGFHPGAPLDNGGLTNHGRIGCKVAPLKECPFVWQGPTTDTLFLRY